MAGGAAADQDMVAAHGFEAELVVKRGYPVNLAGRDVEMFGDLEGGVLGNIAVLALHVL